MKFETIPYQRPDIKVLSQQMHALIEEFGKADAKRQIELVNEINKLRNHFETMFSFASIRYSQDTSNKNYQEEQDFFDANEPVYTGLVTEFYKALVHSKHLKELQK